MNLISASRIPPRLTSRSFPSHSESPVHHTRTNVIITAVSNRFARPCYLHAYLLRFIITLHAREGEEVGDVYGRRRGDHSAWKRSGGRRRKMLL